MYTFSTDSQFGLNTSNTEVGGNLSHGPYLRLVIDTAIEGVQTMEAVVARNLVPVAPIGSIVEKPVEPVENSNMDIEEARRLALEAA